MSIEYFSLLIQAVVGKPTAQDNQSTWKKENGACLKKTKHLKENPSYGMAKPTRATIAHAVYIILSRPTQYTFSGISRHGLSSTVTDTTGSNRSRAGRRAGYTNPRVSQGHSRKQSDNGRYPIVSWVDVHWRWRQHTHRCCSDPVYCTVPIQPDYRRNYGGQYPAISAYDSEAD